MRAIANLCAPQLNIPTKVQKMIKIRLILMVVCVSLLGALEMQAIFQVLSNLR
jgi:hypothetical protein